MADVDPRGCDTAPDVGEGSGRWCGPSFSATSRNVVDDAAAAAMAASGYLRQGLRCLKWPVSIPWAATRCCSLRRCPPLGLSPRRRMRSFQVWDSATALASMFRWYLSVAAMPLRSRSPVSGSYGVTSHSSDSREDPPKCMLTGLCHRGCVIARVADDGQDRCSQMRSGPTAVKPLASGCARSSPCS